MKESEMGVRELDARVAKGMGHEVEWRWCHILPGSDGEWEECEHLYSEPEGSFDYTPQHLEQLIERKEEANQWPLERHPCTVETLEDDYKFYEVAPFYSTSDWWQVVEWMRELSYEEQQAFHSGLISIAIRTDGSGGALASLYWFLLLCENPRRIICEAFVEINDG